MNISALIENKKDEHVIVLSTDGREQSLTIQPKLDGFGSSANGGELLFLALATCYCNDLYREARERGIAIERVQVEVTGEFGAEGTAARNISYRASVDAKAAREEIIDLMRHTDSLAEIQNTLRCSSPNHACVLRGAGDPRTGVNRSDSGHRVGIDHPSFNAILKGCFRILIV